MLRSRDPAATSKSRCRQRLRDHGDTSARVAVPAAAQAAGDCIVFMTVAAAVVALAAPWPLAFLRRWFARQRRRNEGEEADPPWITALFGHSPYQLIVAAVIAGLPARAVDQRARGADRMTSTPSSPLRMTQQFRSRSLPQRASTIGRVPRRAIRRRFHRSHQHGVGVGRQHHRRRSRRWARVSCSSPGMAFIVYRMDHVLRCSR